MSCCESYIKLGCFGSCEPVSTGILAPADDSYHLFLEFNFGLTEIEYILNLGDEFVIPCPFNENYIYDFYITDSLGVVLNDTCYRFQTRLVNSGSAASSCVGTGGDSCVAAIATVGVLGTTIVLATLNDYTAFTISIGGTTYVDGWTQVGDTITFTNGVIISTGDVIKILGIKI